MSKTNRGGSRRGALGGIFENSIDSSEYQKPNIATSSSSRKRKATQL